MPVAGTDEAPARSPASVTADTRVAGIDLEILRPPIAHQPWHRIVRGSGSPAESRNAGQ